MYEVKLHDKWSRISTLCYYCQLPVKLLSPPHTKAEGISARWAFTCMIKRSLLFMRVGKVCLCELTALEASRCTSLTEWKSMNELTKRVITLNTDPGWRTPQPGLMKGGSEGRGGEREERKRGISVMNERGETDEGKEERQTAHRKGTWMLLIKWLIWKKNWRN